MECSTLVSVMALPLVVGGPMAQLPRYRTQQPALASVQALFSHGRVTLNPLQVTLPSPAHLLRHRRRAISITSIAVRAATMAPLLRRVHAPRMMLDPAPQLNRSVRLHTSTV